MKSPMIDPRGNFIRNRIRKMDNNVSGDFDHHQVAGGNFDNQIPGKIQIALSAASKIVSRQMLLIFKIFTGREVFRR